MKTTVATISMYTRMKPVKPSEMTNEVMVSWPALIAFPSGREPSGLSWP